MLWFVARLFDIEIRIQQHRTSRRSLNYINLYIGEWREMLKEYFNLDKKLDNHISSTYVLKKWS